MKIKIELELKDFFDVLHSLTYYSRSYFDRGNMEEMRAMMDLRDRIEEMGHSSIMEAAPQYSCIPPK